MFTYQETDTKVFMIRVLLDGKIVGMIRKEAATGDYYYAPKSGGKGQRRASIDAVKRSIETE